MAIPTPTVQNVTLSTHLNEYNVAIPRCSGLTIKTRAGSASLLYVYFIAHGNGLPAKYFTIDAGQTLSFPGMIFDAFTLYMQGSVDGDVAEIIYNAA